VNDSEKKAHVSKNIRRFREELGATQQEVADRAGITVFSISRYEQGGEPGRDQLLKLASAFARPVEHFYMKEPPAADPLTQRVWSVRWKIVGTPPPGMEEELRRVVEKFTPDEAKRVADEKAKERAARPKLPPPKSRSNRPK